MGQLPFQFFIQYHTIASRCIILSKAVCLILNTEHQHLIFARVLQRTLSLWCNADNTTFSYREDLTINLILAFTFKDKVKFLVCLVAVKEAAILPRNKGLE